jgi:hypothetical protein
MAVSAERVFSMREQINTVGKVVLQHRKSGQPIRKVLVLKADQKRKQELVAASVGKRKITIIHGMAYLECRSNLHRGSRLRPVTDFGAQTTKRGIFLFTHCRRCHTEYRTRQKPNYSNRANHGLVPLYRIQPHLNEIINRCGGRVPACRALGISIASLHRWTGDSKQQVKCIQTENAAKILKVLRDLRSGKISEAPRKPGTKPVVLEL